MMRKMSNAAFSTEPMSPGKHDGTPKDRRISLLPGTDVGNRRQSMLPGSGASGLQRPSIAGLLASKRFAKRLSKRFISMRTGSIALSSRMSEANIINREPTYRMEPLEIFEEAKVKEVIKECIDCRLMGYKYNPKMASAMCKVLSEDIKERVKNLNYERYKIIVLVHLDLDFDFQLKVLRTGQWNTKQVLYLYLNVKSNICIEKMSSPIPNDVILKPNICCETMSSPTPNDVVVKSNICCETMSSLTPNDVFCEKMSSSAYYVMSSGHISYSSVSSEEDIIGLYTRNLDREPTYRMEPLEIFEEAKVKEVIKECIDCRLTGYKYNPKMASAMCKVLSEDIKERVKNLNYERYKIIVLVHLGERRDQGIVVTSRCVWDQNFDNYATYNYQNDNIFCTVTVNGIYNE